MVCFITMFLLTILFLRFRCCFCYFFFFFSSRRRHTRFDCDWSSDVCSSDLPSGRSAYPVFFQQEAVIALQEHLKSSPTQAIFGFLIGDLYRDPETGVLYRDRKSVV